MAPEEAERDLVNYPQRWCSYPFLIKANQVLVLGWFCCTNSVQAVNPLRTRLLFHLHESHCRVASFSRCIHLQFPSIVRNDYGTREQIRLHWLFTRVAPGFACLLWHPHMTDPLTTVALISKKKKDWICSLFSGGWVWTHYTKSWCGITLMISVDLMLQFWSFASSVQDTPGTYITHSATRPLSDITGGKFIRFHAALSGATKWIYTSISRHSAALSVTRKHTLMCKNGAVTL